MRKFSLLIVLFSAVSGAFAQDIEKELKSFTKIIASPRINLILKKGERESIKVVYEGVAKSKINIEVNGKTLSIFLDKARKVEKPSPHNDHQYRSVMMYEGATVTAYVTYKQIESLEIRGNQELTCNDPIESESFRLKAYGENDITLASLKTEYFKASLYGENELKVKRGKVVEQKYRLYGENKIDTREMKCAYTSTAIFGEGRVSINSTEEVRVDAFGEPTIYVRGGGQVNKRLIFGKTYIRED